MGEKVSKNNAVWTLPLPIVLPAWSMPCCIANSATSESTGTRPAPLLVLIPGGLGLALYLRRRGRASAAEPTPLTAEEQRTLADILKTGDAP